MGSNPNAGTIKGNMMKHIGPFEAIVLLPVLAYLAMHVSIGERKNKYLTSAPEGREVPKPNDTRVARFVKNIVGFPD